MTLEGEDARLLADAVYALKGVMAGVEAWCVNTQRPLLHPQVRGEKELCFTETQLMELVKEVFSADDDSMEEAVKEATERKAVRAWVDVAAREGQVTWRKGATQSPWQDKTSRAYLSIMAPQQTPQASTPHRPVNLQWQYAAKMDIDSHQTDHILVQFWLSREVEGRFQTIIGDVVQMAPSPTETVLVADFIIPVKNLMDREVNKWCEFELAEDAARTDITAVRSHLKCNINFEADLAQREQAYEALLRRIIQYEVSLLKEPLSTLWRGDIGQGSAAILTHFGAAHNLPHSTQFACWCKEAAQELRLDHRYKLSLFEELPDLIQLKYFTPDDLAVLREAVILCLKICSIKIMSLDTNFPVASQVSSELQLTKLLQLMKYLHKQDEINKLLYQYPHPLIHECIEGHLQACGLEWIKKLEKATMMIASAPLDKLSAALTLTKEVEWFLRDPSALYQRIFMEQVNFNYYRTFYITVVSEVVEILEPVITTMCLALLETRYSGLQEQPLSYDFGLGSDLLKTYRNLCVIRSQGKRGEEDLASRTGLLGLDRWFEPAVMDWLIRTSTLAAPLVTKAVEADAFEPTDDVNTFSSSASDMTGIFHTLKAWWWMVNWQEPDTRNTFGLKLLKDQCDVAVLYCRLLHQRGTQTLSGTPDAPWLDNRVGVVVANMVKVRVELGRLPGIFGLEERHTSHKGVSEHVANVVHNAQEDVATKITVFIREVIKEVMGTFRRAVSDACVSGDLTHIIYKLLDPALDALHATLDHTYFRQFLDAFWEEIINVFMIKINEERQFKSEHFHNMWNILDGIYKCLTPEGVGLDKEMAKIPGYSSIIDELKLLKLGSNALIANYYKERGKEADLYDVAPQVIITGHIRDSELHVSVLMAQNLQVGEGELAALQAYYVTLELLPRDWFPAPTHKTQSLKMDPAVFYKDFKFEKVEDDKVDQGLLLVRLMEHHTLHPDVLVGEAPLPLVHLHSTPTHNSPNDTPHSPNDTPYSPNHTLKMTRPRLDKNYRQLQILRSRKNDTSARQFLKVFEKRHPDVKLSSKH